MLCLSRKKGEKIIIGLDIVITINEIQGNTARIGIEAPSHIKVDRMEVRERKEEQSRMEDES